MMLSKTLLILFVLFSSVLPFSTNAENVCFSENSALQLTQDIERLKIKEEQLVLTTQAKDLCEERLDKAMKVIDMDEKLFEMQEKRFQIAENTINNLDKIIEKQQKYIEKNKPSFLEGLFERVLYITFGVLAGIAFF